MSYIVSKKQAILILVCFIVIVIVVGLIAGLTGKGCDEGGSASTTTTTSSPDITTPEPEITTAGDDGPWTNPFLPESTIPVHYDLYFDPDFYYDGTTYSGKVDIQINITDATEYLIVHQKMMTITKTEVKMYGTDEVLTVKKASEYERNQYWVTQLSASLAAGDVVVLTLEFESSLVNGIVGFYKSNYTNTITQERSWLATTKFQPTDARKAFPCFDEPARKATFQVSLHHWANFTALNNMPEESNVTDGIWRTTTFQRSPPMSTYLVCFIVCDFEYKSNTLKNGVEHRIWASPDKINQTDYALETGQVVADYFMDLLSIDYHLPKLDQIAIPDFPSGAMEHWGLITYRETSLLYDEVTVSAQGKERVALVIAHELAHNYFGNVITCVWWDEIWLNEGFANFYETKGMASAEPTWQSYFGNVITCVWWDEIWLNEGFARYFQYKSIKSAEPDWQPEDYFAVRTQQGVMRTDAGSSSRPVVVRVTDPDDINQAFDGITYDKGGSLLRMIENFMGEERFNRGIADWVNSHQFGTVTTDDLWASLQKEMGNELDIKAVMDPWAYQMGLPVLNITVMEDGRYKASPQRFLTNPGSDPSLPASDYGYVWYVPLTFITQDGSTGSKWVNETELVFDVPQDAASWVKFNLRQAGFYRVNYPADIWQALASQLLAGMTEFDAIDRSSILDDALNLARATQLDYPTVLDLIQYMKDETEYFPWRTASSSLTYISTMLYGNSAFAKWRNFVAGITATAMDKLQVTDSTSEPHLDRMARTYIINLACNHGYEPCLTNTTALFKDWIADEEAGRVPVSLQQEIYGYGMREEGGEEEFDEMWNRYVTSNSAQEKLYILYGLAQSPHLWLLQRYLEYCMDESKIRRQDFFSAVSYASSNPFGELYVWEWAQENYDALIARFGTQDRYFGRMVPDIVSGFKSEFRLQGVKEFYEKYPDAGAGTTPRAQSIATIEANIAWVNNNQDAIIDWLNTNVD